VTDVCWNTCSADDVPPDDGWLGPGQRVEKDAIRPGKRRSDWRLGRWTARRLLRAAGLVDAEVVKDEGGAPVVVAGGDRLPVAISISHRAGRAMAAIATEPDRGIGCDIELVEPRRDAFVRDFFTDAEQWVVDGAGPAERALLVTVIWSAKESVLKLLRTGLRRDTRTVEVSVARPGAIPWHSFVVRDRLDGVARPGYWRALDGLVATVVATDTTRPPRKLSA